MIRKLGPVRLMEANAAIKRSSKMKILSLSGRVAVFDRNNGRHYAGHSLQGCVPVTS